MYKVYDAELETIIEDWHMEWQVSISIEEVSMVPLAYASMDIVPNPPSNHESTATSTQTPTDSEAEQDFEESWTKKRQDQGVTSSAAAVTKEKLSHIIIAITTRTDAMREQMNKKVIDRFCE